jgi:hypothetical protein
VRARQWLTDLIDDHASDCGVLRAHDDRRTKKNEQQNADGGSRPEAGPDHGVPPGVSRADKRDVPEARFPDSRISATRRLPKRRGAQ